MAAYEDGSYSCLPGIALIAKVLAGRCQMHYTRAAVGNGAIPEGTSPKTMTEPAGYVMEAKISAITNPTDGECQVTVQVDSAEVGTGFFATGILLYAEDPDEGEVPYTYLMLENEPEWIRPASSAVGKLATFELIAAVGDVDKVSATLDPDAFMNREEMEKRLEEHEKDPNAHEGLFGPMRERLAQAEQNVNDILSSPQASVAAADITIPVSGWVDDTDTGGAYALHTDITVAESTSDLIPVLTLPPESRQAARACGLCSTAQTLDGVLRVYAAQAPEADIPCSLVLLGSGGTVGTGGSGTGSGYALPVATATRLGGVKIGDGVAVETDGTISVDGTTIVKSVAAPDGDVEEMLDAVLDSTTGR